jgi:hypothetical protein
MSVLGHQANLKETREVLSTCWIEAQVLGVVKMSDACESKKEIMRLKSDLQSEDRRACY